MRDMIMHTKIWWENLKERDHLEDIGIGGIIILNREIGWESVDWFHLTQDRGQWWILVNMVMHLQVPKR
jgi:hypothetical protein